MNNYVNNIKKSGFTIYDLISPDNKDLYIPTNVLEKLLCDSMIGMSLDGLALRTRSKVVKSEVCKVLGYPIPKSFKKTKPRFPGQNFDIYTQKSSNLQIWNEEIDISRRYVFFDIDKQNRIVNVRVLTGETLVQFDKTGNLTKKYQATMHHYSTSTLFSNDSITIQNWIIETPSTLTHVNPNSLPTPNQLLRIDEIYKRLLPITGNCISYLDPIQERNRGAELHKLICKYLGYSTYEDDGTYPDIANQLLEVKLQTSPTIDLGLHSPEDGAYLFSLGETSIHSEDIRYAIFDGEVIGNQVHLKNLYLISGEKFSEFFPIWEGENSKIQIPLPADFFD